MDHSLAALLQLACPIDASDLFLSENRPAILRRNTRLQEVTNHPITTAQMESLFHTCGTDPATTNDHDVSFTSADGLRFRINLHRRAGKLAAVLRHVRTQIPNMETLGLPEIVLTRWLTKEAGIIIITGSTSCGKSTTVASCLEWINQNTSRHIVTIEDPVEYVFEDARSFFTQREIGTDTASFATGIRSALRQSPDVIFVGEIRDRETASIALQAAETGQLVITTMQSSTVRDTFRRLFNLFPVQDRASASYLISHQLLGVVCQQLLPGTNDGLFLGLEYFENAAATRDWIRDGEPEKILEHARTHDPNSSMSFLDSLIWGVKNGYLDRDVALSACDNDIEFNRSLRGIA
ncbi:MAG: ATPase, T2SS/T4P/T4SS family [Verrucomicrobiales bacterium]|nr:ATPase, T2SS/T4P/T4SS family [Verrucomicrobiales bacterium]